MRTKINLKNAAVNIVEYLFVIIIILNCNTIWTSYEDTPLNKILKVAMVAVAALYFIAYGKISKRDFTKVGICAVICVIYIFLYTIVVQYNSQRFLYFIIDVLCIYLVVMIAKTKDGGYGIFTKYVNIMIILSIISLFFWLFGSTLGIIKSTGITYSTWTGNDNLKAVPSYYNLYFETQTASGIIRNTGIFTEAPMYNFILCIALLIELFYKKNSSLKKCLVIIITIFTTISTIGWIIAIIAVTLKFIFDNKIKGFVAVLRCLLVPILLIVAIFVIQILIDEKLGTNSGSIRVDDFIAGYKAWLTSPIFGSGIYNSDYVKHFMSGFRSYNQGFSNSPMQILYQGGIFLFTPYLCFAIKWVWKCIQKKDMQKFLFIACFLFLFIFTVVSYNFIAIFIFMASDFVDKSTKQKRVLLKSKKAIINQTQKWQKA